MSQLSVVVLFSEPVEGSMHNSWFECTKNKLCTCNSELTLCIKPCDNERSLWFAWWDLDDYSGRIIIKIWDSSSHIWKVNLILQDLHVKKGILDTYSITQEEQSSLVNYPFWYFEHLLKLQSCQNAWLNWGRPSLFQLLDISLSILDHNTRNTRRILLLWIQQMTSYNNG